MAEKVLLACPQCGSHNVWRDATAGWCGETQDWVLKGVQDAGGCDDCGADEIYCFEEVPVTA